jgi:penicillin-binding protein 2
MISLASPHNLVSGRNTSVDVGDASLGRLPDRSGRKASKANRGIRATRSTWGSAHGDLLVTPLQMATVAALIANRGHWIRPRLLLSSDQALTEWDPPPPMPDVTNLVSASDWERLIDAMEMVVHRGNLGYQQSGTAFPYIGKDLPYRMAGKSGTAQVVGIKQGRRTAKRTRVQRKHAWFIAFAPADAPDPCRCWSKRRWRQCVAAPVARQVIDAFCCPSGGAMSSRDYVGRYQAEAPAVRQLNNMHLDPLLLPH